MLDIFPCKELHRENGVLYRLAGTADSDAMTDLLGRSFTEEPMSKALGLSAAELSAFAARFIPECTKNGLSVVAISEASPERLVGVFINRDFKSPLPPGMLDDFPRLSPVFRALDSIDEEYEAQVPGLSLGQVVDLWMVAVELGGPFARRGIATNLFRLSVEVARERGFERCVSECTGHFSQRCALANGFEERAHVVYKDFVFEGRNVFASVPEPHRKLALYELILAR